MCRRGDGTGEWVGRFVPNVKPQVLALNYRPNSTAKIPGRQILSFVPATPHLRLNEVHAHACVYVDMQPSGELRPTGLFASLSVASYIVKEVRSMRDSNILVTLGLLLALDVLANELFDVRECAFVSSIGTESLPLQSCTDNRRRRARPDGWRPCLADGQNAAVHVDHANGDSLLLRARRSVVVAQVKALIHCKCLHDRLLGLAQPLLLEPNCLQQRAHASILQRNRLNIFPRFRERAAHRLSFDICSLPFSLHRVET